MKSFKTAKNLFKWLGKSVSRISGAILNFISLITAIYGFVQLFLGNRQILFIVLIILGMLVWLATLGRLAYVGYSKRDKKTSRRHKQVHKFEDHLIARQWFISLSIITIFALIGVTLFSYNKDRELRSKTIILLTNFKGPNPENYLINEKLYKQLNDSLKIYPDILLQTTNEDISEQEGSKEAQNIGDRYRADLVLWGYYGVTNTDALITLHVENLNTERALPLPGSISTEILVAVEHIDSFVIQQKLADQMTSLVYFIAGITRQQSGSHKEAISLFNLALESPEWSNQVISKAYVFDYRGKSYRALNNIDGAISDFTQAIDLNDQEPKFYVDRASASQKKGNLDISLEDLNIAIKLDNGYYLAYVNKAYVYIERNKFAEAFSELEFSRKLEPLEAEVHIAYAYYYFKQNDYQNAIEYASQAIKLSESDPAYYHARALFHIGNNNYKEAIKDLNYAIRVNPSNGSYYNTRAIAYAGLQDTEKACDDVETAIEKFGQTIIVESYMNLANCHNRRGQTEKAIQAFTVVIEQTPQTKFQEKIMTDALIRRAQLYLLLGDTENAIKDYRQLLILADDVETRNLADEQLRLLGAEP